MNILFIHQNFPGQYRHLVAHYSRMPECDVAIIGERKNLFAWEGIKGIRIHGYSIEDSKRGIHPYLQGFDSHVRRGQVVAMVASELKKSGFYPDIICVHTGWGEGLYLRDVFPDAKILSYCEFYYNSENSDVDFDRSKPITLDNKLKTRTQNSTQLLSFASSDWGISPTVWQKGQYPQIIKERISVIHDGIDTSQIKSSENAHCVLQSSNVKLTSNDEVITFVNRNIEPYRGFHIFAKALPLLQKARPKAHIIIVGGDGVSYGARPPAGTTFREMFMKPVINKLDMKKIHFVGRVPRNVFTKILQISSVHVYLTYPFVLSWSLLEAMSAGCVVVGSKTPPVEEVVAHNKNGFLVDFFSPDEICEYVNLAFTDKEKMAYIGREARNTIVTKYDLKSVCLPQQISLITSLAERGIPCAV